MARTRKVTEPKKEFADGKVDPKEASAKGVEVRERNRERALLEAAKVDESDGLTDCQRMRKVFSQGPLVDSGNREKVLRAWLEKDTKGYLDRMAALEEEGATRERVKAAAVEEDEGGDRARELIDRILEEAAA